MLAWEIIIRLCIAIFIGGLIGYEREAKNRPAGIRTHILVCLGSAIIAMIQMEVVFMVARLAVQGGAVRSDPVRLIAQVVSGIGFLGAGTIIFERGKLTGLTTAASLWTTAALGIATGMGFYYIALFGVLAMYIVLAFSKNIINVNVEKKIEIRYIHRLETQGFLSQYFEAKNIEILNADFDVSIRNDRKVYTHIYTIDFHKDTTYLEIIEELAEYKNVMRLRVLTV